MNKSNNITLSECLGSQVKEARIKKDMTQRELADTVGTYQPSIARIESGKVLPSLAFLKRITDSLGAEMTIGIK